jgi:hypothetical protein
MAMPRPASSTMYGITKTTVHVTYRPITRADVEAGQKHSCGIGSHVWRFVAILEPICAREHAICCGAPPSSYSYPGQCDFRYPLTLHPGRHSSLHPAGGIPRILSPSITIAINGANAVNWSDFRKDFYRYYMAGRKLPPSFVNAYLLFVGKWLAMFAPH